MYDEYSPGFARHKGGASDEIAEFLFENEMIAIRWKDLPSADPDDYDGRGSDEISNLNQFAEDGAIVGASYRDATKTEMLVGIVEPGTGIELIELDGNNLLNRASVSPGESNWEAFPNDPEGLVFKGIELSDVQLVSIEDYPVLFESGVRPRHWSVCNWWQGEEHLRAVANRSSKPFEVTSLKPDQIEILCEEYLRIVDSDYTRLAGIGGQTADVDINGVSDGQRIWGQVTMGGETAVQEKLDTLSDYTGESTDVLMFAPADSKPDSLPKGVTYLPVEAVFKTVSLNGSGQRMLEEMLNVGVNRDQSTVE
jgi:hypothetical protein